MAQNENIGGVSVTISGDTAPLLQAFSQAQGAAAQAGSAIAGSFSQGAASTNTMASAARGAATAEAELGAAVESSAAAMDHQVTQIQAVSGALRTLEGTGGIRAAERFLTLIPGVGQALQVGFPVVGAIALGEALMRVTRESEDLKQSVEQLKEATKEADDEFSHFVTTVDRLGAARIGKEFGGAAEARARATALKKESEDAGDAARKLAFDLIEADRVKNDFFAHPISTLTDFTGSHAQALQNNIDAIGQKIDKQIELSKTKAAEAQAALRDAEQQGAKESGEVSAQSARSRQSLDNDTLQSARERIRQKIKEEQDAAKLIADSYHDSRQREIADADAQVAAAKARLEQEGALVKVAVAQQVKDIRDIGAAQAQGADSVEREKIGAATKGEVDKATRNAANEQIKLADDVVNAENRAKEVRATAAREYEKEWRDVGQKALGELLGSWKEFDAETARIVNEQIARQARVQEIEEKASGRVGELKIDQQKIALEAQYNAVRTHSLAEQRAYLEQIAELERQATEQQIQGLELAKATAEAMGEEGKFAAARAQGEIDILRQQQRNQQTRTQGQIQNASLGKQISDDIKSGANSVADAVARGVVNGGHGIGKEVEGALKGAAQSVLGSVLRESMQRLVSAILANTVTQSILHAIFGSSIGVQAANTAAVTASTVAQTGATIASVTNTAAVIALTAAVAELATVMTISVFTGGFAEGTDFAPGGSAVVGERGPEIVNLPRGSQVIPNHMIKKYANGAGLSAISSSDSGTHLHGDLHVHAHGITDPGRFTDHVVRTIPKVIRTRSSKGAPYSS